MLYSTMIKLLVCGYLLLLNPIECKIYGTYSTFDPLGPYTGNQTHKHSPTGLITHYSVNGNSHGQDSHRQESHRQDSHRQESHRQDSHRQESHGQESVSSQLPQKRQDYQQQSNPPPVEAQPFTPPQHEDTSGLWMTSGQSGQFNGGMTSGQSGQFNGGMTSGQSSQFNGGHQSGQHSSGQQLQTYHEDPAIAKPFEMNHAKNPTAAPLTSAASSTHTGSTAGGRMPLYLYNPSLARRLGISTFITGSVLYGLSLLPALLAVGVGSGVGPFAGLMSTLTGSKRKRRKRRHIPMDHQNQKFNNSLQIVETQTMKYEKKFFPENEDSFHSQTNGKFGSRTSPLPPGFDTVSNFDTLPSVNHEVPDVSLYVTKRSPGPYIPSTMHYKYREMPMMDHRSSYRFLGLFENTLEVRRIEDSSCKRNLLCNVYKQAIGISDHPTPADFEVALIDTFGIAAERTNHKVDVISMVKYYLDAALVGMTRGGSCSKVFPCIHSTAFFRYFPVAAALGSGHHSSISGQSGHSHPTTVPPTSPASPLPVPFQEKTKTIKLNLS